MTQREKIAARIRALREMTVENGCTEAEALAAAQRVADLLARYNMTLDEAEMRASPFARRTDTFVDEVGTRLWKVADGIAHLTGARYWTSRPGMYPVEINFFGFAHEVEVSRYLLHICARAMRSEEAAQHRHFALLVAHRRRAKVAPFLDGMADRLRQRIRAMKPPAPTGTGLVVLHGALIDAAMQEAGLELREASARGSRDLEQGYGEGWTAGGRVPLNQGLGGAPRTAGLLR